MRKMIGLIEMQKNREGNIYFIKKQIAVPSLKKIRKNKTVLIAGAEVLTSHRTS